MALDTYLAEGAQKAIPEGYQKAGEILFGDPLVGGVILLIATMLLWFGLSYLILTRTFGENADRRAIVVLSGGLSLFASYVIGSFIYSYLALITILGILLLIFLGLFLGGFATSLWGIGRAAWYAGREWQWTLEATAKDKLKEVYNKEIEMKPLEAQAIAMRQLLRKGIPGISPSYLEDIRQKIEAIKIAIHNLISNIKNGYIWESIEGYFKLENEIKRLQKEIENISSLLGGQSSRLYGVLNAEIEYLEEALKKAFSDIKQWVYTYIRIVLGLIGKLNNIQGIPDDIKREINNLLNQVESRINDINNAQDMRSLFRILSEIVYYLASIYSRLEDLTIRQIDRRYKQYIHQVMGYLNCIIPKQARRLIY